MVPKAKVSRTGFGEEVFKASGQLRLIPSISLLSAKRHSFVVSSHGRSLHPPPAPHGHLREPRFKYSEVDIPLSRSMCLPLYSTGTRFVSRPFHDVPSADTCCHQSEVILSDYISSVFTNSTLGQTREEHSGLRLYTLD